MKTISYKALRGLMNFFFVLFILTGVPMLILSGMKWIESPAEFTIGMGMNQTYDINNEAGAIISSNRDVSEATFVTSRIGINSKTTSSLIKSFMVGASVIRFLYALVIIYCLRSIVLALHKQNPFTSQNIKLL